MSRFVSFLAVTIGLIFLVGFLGQHHPMLDALAAGRKFAAFGALFFLTTYFLIARRSAFFVFGIVLIVLFGSISRIAPSGESGNIRVYTKNLFYGNTDFLSVAEDIRATAPDIVILQEVSGTNNKILTELRYTLPFQALCPWQGWNGIAILSRWPFSKGEPACSPERSLMAVKVMRPGAPFWAVGVHLQQPWPDVQWLHLERALPVLNDINRSAIVAGDFNTMPWTAAARKIGEITGTKHVDLRRPTFRLWGMGLPLDQVWALGGRAQSRPAFGSDHLGVLADVWPSEMDHLKN